MAKKYLDSNGLSHLWSKLKAYFQQKLVSGTNIKTINNQSLLGSGNISISGGSGGGSGDMEKAVYDTDDDGVVDEADNALQLGGVAAGDYAQSAGLFKITTAVVSVPATAAHASVSASSHTITAQPGYNAVGIVGYSSGSWRIRPTTNYIESNTSLYAGFCNDSASATSQAYNVTFRILWLKATEG